MSSEPWSWSKALYGLVDPMRWGKDVLTLIRLIAIAALCFFIYLGAKEATKWVQPKKTQPSVEQITVNDKGKASTDIDSSVNSKKYWKFGLNIL